MKISRAPYLMKPMQSLNAVTTAPEREGSLLKITWPNGWTGYSDLHPWPELGDEKLSYHFEQLKKFKLTPLMEASIALAKRDAEARSENRNLWVPGVQLRNNFLINDVNKLKVGGLDAIVGEGYTTVKIKCGRDLDEEAAVINRIAGRKDLKIRMDFNAIGGFDFFKKFMDRVNRESDPWIEYVEDPCYYDTEAWNKIRLRWKVALDQALEKIDFKKASAPAADVLVIKPARMDVAPAVGFARRHGLKITVTSSMDHAVGIVHAHAVAKELKKQDEDGVLEAGCLTHLVYQMDVFMASLSVQGPYLQKVPGLGVGFDEMLKLQKWQDFPL